MDDNLTHTNKEESLYSKNRPEMPADFEGIEFQEGVHTPDDFEYREEDTIAGQLKAPLSRYKRITPKDVQLRWTVDDFEGITDSVYEAVMVAAQRARQIARRQKLEIDMYNANMQLEEIEGIDYDREAGTDLFQHPKPIVQALFELKRKRVKFNYKESEEIE